MPLANILPPHTPSPDLPLSAAFVTPLTPLTPLTLPGSPRPPMAPPSLRPRRPPPPPLPARASALFGTAVAAATRTLYPDVAAQRFGVVSSASDGGVLPADAGSAARQRPAYAVASGENLNLTHTPPRRIALLVEPTPFTHVSGYSNRFKNLLLQLKEAGDEVLVIVPDNDPEAPKEFAGARIVNVPGFRFPLYRRITLTFGLKGVYSELKAFDPDVIHLTTPGFLILATLFFARLLRKPLMLSYHTNIVNYAASYGLGWLQAAAWAMLRLEHNRADFTLTTSPQLCEELVSHGFERVGLWRKGIDTHIFSPAFANTNMRSRLTDGNPTDKLIIYVGRVGMEKNLTFFAPLLRRFPKVRLAIVGDGPARGVVEDALAGTKTVFTGILQGDDLSAAFASADVFVMPSESETLGFVVLESMASGVPVVGARAGGIPDIIDHECNGFLFEPGSLDSAAEYLQKLLEDDGLRKRLGDASRAEAERWGWRASAAATRNLGYGRAISNFKYRAWNGAGMPRSLTWMRWLRRRWSVLRERVMGGMHRGTRAVSN